LKELVEGARNNDEFVFRTPGSNWVYVTASSEFAELLKKQSGIEQL
jgi:hypothetical protein